VLYRQTCCRQNKLQHIIHRMVAGHFPLASNI
jgi:hypothetical protein